MRWNPYTSNPVYATGKILLPDFDLVKIQAYLVVEVSTRYKILIKTTF